MAERKRATEDQKTMITAMASGFGSIFSQQMAEAKHKLIEINLNQNQHSGLVKAYLAPINLDHVKIDKNNLVMLITKSMHGPVLEITMEEWERIRKSFGYIEPKQEPQEQQDAPQ